ncbi:Subtilase-type proteinase RRT12 [Spathaspora sp. JA1]|nr:Subtilase-type proteinase RRT12 [Spathaspora sp. JA1]
MKAGETYPYLYDNRFMGKNVNAYVIDSGVEIGHPEFQGRARTGKHLSNEPPGDKSGHGTYVAGLIGSHTYGSAKAVEIIDVKTVDSRGFSSLSSTIGALEFCSNHRLRSRRMGVANLSMGQNKNPILNRAIEEAYKTGLVVVVAAGNSNLNSCLTSPGSAKYAITVGALDDYNDQIASFSNWGECVDLFASGSYVKSVDKNNIHKGRVLSGTSAAAPIVTGLVANLLSQGVEPFEIKNKLIEMSTENRIPESSLFLKPNTPNRIAHGLVEDVENQKDEDDC